MDFSINSVMNVVSETPYARIWERRVYSTEGGDQTVRSQFWSVPIYDRRGELRTEQSQGQHVDVRA